jgi:endonuclease/exonuclease/phosphatase family metal-dependent hydrolase
MTTRRNRTPLWFALAGLFLGASGSVASAGTLRVAAYNVDLDTGTTTPNSSISQVLEDVGSEATYDPAHALDIIGLEETTSNATSVAPIVTTLNAHYGAGTYAMSAVQGTQDGDATGGNGPNALIYNTKTLNLLNSVGVGTPGGSANGEYRQVMRYEFETAGSTSPFYVYVLHSKSGSGSTSTTGNSYYRSEEASIVTANEATLGTGASAIVMGDFNIDGTNESVPTGVTPSYQKFIASGLVDPLNPTNASETYGAGATQYNSILTESTQTTFEYRDDLQLSSTNIYNGTSAALQYVANSEHAFGNNGSVAAGDNFDLSTSAYKTELIAATDHLPIVADYDFTATPEPTSLLTAGLASAALLLRRRRNARVSWRG